MTTTINKKVQEFNISEEIDNYLVKYALRREKYAPGYPSTPGPSAGNIRFEDGTVAGTCIRKSYYRIKGYPKAPTSAYMQKIFKFGNMIEDMAEDYIKRIGYYEDSSLRFMLHDIRVKGELDFIANVPGVGRFIIENKSYYGYDAKKKIQGNSRHKQEPKIDNLLQLFIYIYAFREGNQYGFEPLDGGKLLYWCRDDCVISSFDVQLFEKDGDYFPIVNGEVYSHVSMNAIKDSYNRLWSYLDKTGDERETPPRDFNPFPSDEEVEVMFEAGTCTKTAYGKFEKKKDDFNRMQCANWQCRYCEYRDTICLQDN